MQPSPEKRTCTKGPWLSTQRRTRSSPEKRRCTKGLWLSTKRRTPSYTPPPKKGGMPIVLCGRPNN